MLTILFFAHHWIPIEPVNLFTNRADKTKGIVLGFLQLDRRRHWRPACRVRTLSATRVLATGKTEGPQRIGFQGDIRRRDGEA
jgi:hypothetical protein